MSLRPPIRTLIAEDEPASRRRMTRLLRTHCDFEVVAECADGIQAVDALRTLRPDAAFLDVQMPGLDGFDVLRSIPPDRLPLVVFVTAYDHYALRAFEVRALDYLLKPYDDERFERAVEWVREHVASENATALKERIREMLGPSPSSGTARYRVASTERLAVRDGERITFVPVAGITHVTGEGCYARIATPTRSYLVRETLANLESRLPAGQFVRIHKSSIVNLAAVESMEPLPHGEFRLLLAQGGTLKVSRTFRAAVLSLLD